MVDIVTDPAFWLAVLCWLIIVAWISALCVAGARDDRMVERARADVRERATDRESAVFERHIGGWRR